MLASGFGLALKYFTELSLVSVGILGLICLVHVFKTDNLS